MLPFASFNKPRSVIERISLRNSTVNLRRRLTSSARGTRNSESGTSNTICIHHGANLSKQCHPTVRFPTLFPCFELFSPCPLWNSTRLENMHRGREINFCYGLGKAGNHDSKHVFLVSIISNLLSFLFAFSKHRCTLFFWFSQISSLPAFQRPFTSGVVVVVSVEAKLTHY